MAWTQVMVESLRAHVADTGKSARDIANALSSEFGMPFTREAVIGKYTRLGLAATRAKPARSEAAPKGLKERKPPKRRPAPVEHRPPALEVVRIAAAPVMELPAVLGGVPLIPEGSASLPCTACRWPLWGETRTGMVCGATCKDGKPYCADHCRIAYQPPAERKPGEKKRVAA